MPVSVTAELTNFQLGGVYSQDQANFAGLSVNNNDISFDASNPTSVNVPLSGSQVAFGYSQSWLQQVGTGINLLSFNGSTNIEIQGVGSNNMFKLGTLSYTNGSFYPLAFVDFTLTTHSLNSLYDNHQLTGRFVFNSTNPNSPYTAEDQADYISVQNSFGVDMTGLGSIRVYDNFACPTHIPTSCNTGTVDVFGYINSLHLHHFGNPTNGAFLNASIGHALSPPASNVSEPNIIALFLIGAGILGSVKRQSRLQQ